MAFEQWRHPKKTFDTSQSSQESLNSPKSINQQEESINRPNTSRGEEIFEEQAGSTPKSQMSSSKDSKTKSSGTCSLETDCKSDQEEPKDSKK